MRLPVLAIALSTLCLTGCVKEPPRSVPVTPDAGEFAHCPATFPPAPVLAPLQPFTLADGRVVVLLETVIERDGLVARYIVSGRGAWHECRSAVDYVQDWSARLSGAPQ